MQACLTVAVSRRSAWVAGVGEVAAMLLAAGAHRSSLTCAAGGNAVGGSRCTDVCRSHNSSNWSPVISAGWIASSSASIADADFLF